MTEPGSDRDFAELEEGARATLTESGFQFLADAAGDGTTARWNLDAFRSRAIVPRMLTDVRAPSTATVLLGQQVRTPVGVSPLPRMNLVHPSAERGLRDAARAAGGVFCGATNSSVPLEELVTDGLTAWFQLYPHPDPHVTADLVQRVAAAGYHALVVTLDRPVRGDKASEAAKSRRAVDYPNLAVYGEAAVADRYDPAFTWSDLSDLVDACPLPVVAKGVMAPQDASLAIEAGCSAVWVSNHGGRQLDRVLATLDALPAVVDAVAGRAEIYLDGGVRTGTDVLIALALGAQAVFVGRPVAYALANGGAADAAAYLHHMTAALTTAMSLSGCADLEDAAQLTVVEYRQSGPSDPSATTSAEA
jgi:4-hydroxymandelate oxidase